MALSFSTVNPGKQKTGAFQIVALKPHPIRAYEIGKFAFPSPNGEGSYSISQSKAIGWGEVLKGQCVSFY
jgi:hypothetical protein